MDSSTKPLIRPNLDVHESALLPSPQPTPQTAETPAQSPQPPTNSFRPTVVSRADQDSAEGDLPQPGAIIDGYAVIETIASTRMSIVFKARQPDTGQLVALKLIRQGTFAAPEASERFQQEINTLGRLQPHRNIVPIYHVGRHRGELYYVMPFLAGGSLASQLPLYQADRRKSVALIEKIARAVHLLHTQTPKILHRDLKPANVLLAADDEPLLADFGLIKLLDDDHSLTATHERPGTPPYMAPEQTGLVPTPANERTDVWALGVILYELLTGRRPFIKTDGEETAKLFWRIVHEPPARLQAMKPDIDAGLQAIILKCLEKNPADRFDSAAELADELERWQLGVTPRTKVVGVVRRAIRRHPVVLALGALMAVSIAVGTPAVVHLRHPDRPLRNFLADLKDGKSAVLIDLKGAPQHSRILFGKDVQMGVGDDGYYFAAAHDLGLVELARDLPVDHYVLRGKIRHMRSDFSGSVGVYFGHSSRWAVWGKYDVYYEIAFNDIIRRDTLVRMRPGAPPGPYPNIVEFHPGLRAELGTEVPWQDTFANSAAGRFDAAGLAGGEWREFRITITPQQLRLQFEKGKEATVEVAAEVRKFVRDRDTRVLHVGPSVDGLRACELTFEPRGSLGIVISGGSAAFADFVLEPILSPQEESP